MMKFPKLIKKIYSFTTILILVIGLSIAFYTRILTYDDFVSFGPDQIRDAEVYAHIKDGRWPTLGPIAPIKDDIEFYLFPLYHYLIGFLILPFKDLNIQLLINGIFSFLSIPLFSLLIYNLLENINKQKRLLLASVGGLWLSVFALDVVNSNLAWNPTPMPFFIILFFLLIDKINKVHENITFIEHYLLWISLGIVTAFLTSLHTWSMLTFLPLMLFNCIYFTILYFNKQKGRKFIYPIISIVYVLMFLSTYIIGEINTDWKNSQNMLNAFSQSASGMGTPMGTILARPFVNFISLIEKGYIVNPDYYLLALPFMLIIICFSFFNFRGNKFLFIQITISIMVYSFGILNYSGEMKSRYQIIMWLYPMILTLIALAYTQKNIFMKSIQLLYTFAFLLISIYFNWIYTNNFLSRVYGDTKLIDTDEMVSILTSLPDRSSICYPWGVGYDYLPQFQFIEKYITNRNHKFINNCRNSDYFIHLKNLPKVNADYSTRKNITKVPSNYEAIMEGTSFIVYKTR